MKYLSKLPFYIPLLILLSIAYFPSLGQAYITKGDGDWASGNNWKVTATGCSQNPSGPVPPLSKDWGCAVDIQIQHQVVYSGSLVNFGNGLVNGLEILPGGSLDVLGDFSLPAHGWGSLTYLKLAEGTSLNVSGSFIAGKTQKIIIPKGATVTVGNLIVDDNNPEIIIEKGAELIVLNATTIKSKSTLHVKGKLSTKTLTNNSGNLVSSGTGNTQIEGNLHLNGSASLVFSDDSKIISKGSLATTGAGLMNFTGSSQVSFAGDMSLSEGSRYTFNGNSDMKVGGNLSSTGGAFITFNGKAKGRVDKEISLKLGAILTINDKTVFSSGSNVFLFDGAKIDVTGDAEGVIGGNVDMKNGEISTSGNATLHIDKTLTAYRDNQVYTRGRSAVYVCDYSNSIQKESKFINTQPDSYYGIGCYSLPVDWVEVKLTRSSWGKNTLTWITAKEWESCHFEIERSINGIDEFIKVGEVGGRGWSSDVTNYSFEDDNLSNLAGDIYYRIKQVDFNGQYDYSKVLKIKGAESRRSPSKWKAYPNPTSGNQLKLSLVDHDFFFRGAVTMRIVSSSFQSEPVTVAYGDELDREVIRLFEKVPQGVVVIELVWEDRVSHLKVVKN